MGKIYIFGWIFDILLAFFLRSMGLELFMMLKVVWRQGYLLLYMMENGLGGLLGLKL